MRIAIYGTGGVGGYFGGRLALNKENEVLFIARGKHYNVLKKSGLKVKSIKGDFQICPVNVFNDPKKVGKVDLVILGVKAGQVTCVAETMMPMLGKHTKILPLQNGIEAPEKIAKITGTGHVLGGLCKISSFIAEPGIVQHVDIEPEIVFGEPDNSLSVRVELIQQNFQSSGFKATVPEDIHLAMWKKFLFISSTGGIGALTRVSVGIIRKIPEIRTIIEQSMNEIVNIANKINIPLRSEDVEKNISFMDKMNPDTIPSLQRDIMDGRPSELNEQVGAVVRLGKKLGIETPVNTFIYNCLLPMEMKARGDI